MACFKLLRPAIILLITVLAACAAHGPPPILSLDGRLCVPQPELISAPLLELDKSAKMLVDGNAACWLRSDGSKSAYVAFQLLPSSEPYIITVSSAPLGAGLFPPELVMLGPQGEFRRTVARESFMFHNSVLQAGIRVHPDEGYLIVASDPPVVGLAVSRITGRTQVSNVNGLAIHTGSEASDTYVYAHNGLVTVAAQALPKVN